MVPVIVSPSHMVNTSSRYRTVCFQCVARDLGPALPMVVQCKFQTIMKQSVFMLKQVIQKHRRISRTSRKLQRSEPVEKPSSLWHIVNDTSK